jgi:hypothetical protein
MSPSVQEFARVLAVAERRARTAGWLARSELPVELACREWRVRVGPSTAAFGRWLIDAGRARDVAGEAELVVELPGGVGAEAYLAEYAAALRELGAAVSVP